MKTKFVSFVAVCMLLSSCSVPAYLPEVYQIPQATRGAYLDVKTSNGQSLNGELIASANDSVYVLQIVNAKKQLVTYPHEKMEWFDLITAKPKNYGWTTPVYALSTLTHGWWLILTLPTNVVVTQVINKNARDEVIFNERSITVSNLFKYARYPQGIPANVKRSSIY